MNKRFNREAARSLNQMANPFTDTVRGGKKSIKVRLQCEWSLYLNPGFALSFSILPFGLCLSYICLHLHE